MRAVSHCFLSYRANRLSPGAIFSNLKWEAWHPFRNTCSVAFFIGLSVCAFLVAHFERTRLRIVWDTGYRSPVNCILAWFRILSMSKPRYMTYNSSIWLLAPVFSALSADKLGHFWQRNQSEDKFCVALRMTLAMFFKKVQVSLEKCVQAWTQHSKWGVMNSLSTPVKTLLFGLTNLTLFRKAFCRAFQLKPDVICIPTSFPLQMFRSEIQTSEKKAHEPGPSKCSHRYAKHTQ